MKKLLYILPLLALSFACKKEPTAVEDDKTLPLIGKSSTVFFVDTFRVYSTDLTGNNKKLIVDEDLKSGNNYITGIDYSASKKLIYGYKTGFQVAQSIKTINTDGTDKKTIKTFSSNTASVNFVASFGGRVLYATDDYINSKRVIETRLMDENGANDAKVEWPIPTKAARDGSGYLSINYDYGTTTPSQTIYRVKINKGVFDEANSFTLPKITGYLRGDALSSDGNTYVYLLAANSDSFSYDVMLLDLSKKGAQPKKIMTYELPKSGDGAVQYPTGVDVTFANGTADLVLSYGISVSSARYATKDDYYFFQVISADKGTVTAKWKIFNEYGGGHIVD